MGGTIKRRPANASIRSSDNFTNQRSSRTAEHRSARVSVLVVEDETLLAEVIKMNLERECEVTIATSRMQATTLIPSGAWRGMIIDVRLGDGDGRALLPLVRANHPPIPVVLMSGSHDAELSHAAYAHGASFVSKPLPADFYATFVESLAASAPNDSLRRGLARIGLSRAEQAVFARLACGDTATEAATRLRLSTHTIRTHTGRVYRRLRVHGLPELLALASGLLKAKQID